MSVLHARQQFRVVRQLQLVNGCGAQQAAGDEVDLGRSLMQIILLHGIVVAGGLFGDRAHLLQQRTTAQTMTECGQHGGRFTRQRWQPLQRQRMLQQLAIAAVEQRGQRVDAAVESELVPEPRLDVLIPLHVQPRLLQAGQGGLMARGR